MYVRVGPWLITNPHSAFRNRITLNLTYLQNLWIPLNLELKNLRNLRNLRIVLSFTYLRNLLNLWLISLS
jgi:hypothetical protein